MNDFREGQYVIYTNGYKYEIGRIKRITKNGAFVAYHEGETGALTDFERIFPIQNDYCIKETTLGGSYFNQRTKIGIWIDCTNSESIDYECRCSVCGYSVFESLASAFKYCPNCGTKMEREYE